MYPDKLLYTIQNVDALFLFFKFIILIQVIQIYINHEGCTCWYIDSIKKRHPYKRLDKRGNKQWNVINGTVQFALVPSNIYFCWNT